ncbi:MAG: hypothetical protein QOJ00_1181 [Actinomycetota bacterium]|jgi:hypothetical protein
MRLSDLTRVAVYDVGGKRIGRLNDVRLVQDGPYVEGFGAGLRVAGFVAGSGRMGERLGFNRGGVDGPWLLKVFFLRLERRGRFVPWDKVARMENDAIHLSVSAAELRPFEPDE